MDLGDRFTSVAAVPPTEPSSLANLGWTLGGPLVLSRKVSRAFFMRIFAVSLILYYCLWGIAFPVYMMFLAKWII
jgi:hypothetical protein